MALQIRRAFCSGYKCGSIALKSMLAWTAHGESLLAVTTALHCMCSEDVLLIYTRHSVLWGPKLT